MSPNWEREEKHKKVSKVLEEIAAEVRASNIQASASEFSYLTFSLMRQVDASYFVLSSVAIAYVMQKAPYVFPIVGGRKVEHLHANIEALDVVLTPEHIKKIEGAVPFELGFPANFIVSVSTDVFL